MVRSKGLAIVAACAALAVGQGVWGQQARAAGPSSPLKMDQAVTPTTAPVPTAGGSPRGTGPQQTGNSADASTPQPPPGPNGGSVPATTTPSPSTPSTPLMGLLEKVGVGHGIEDAGFSITGYVEGGYTYDFSAPTGRLLTDRAFDTRHDSPVLDQVQLDVLKQWDATKPFDFGINFDNVYGTDTPYFHANGLTLVSYGKAASPFAGAGSTATIHPRAQYDLEQANFTIGTNAVAKGIAFEGGKFATLLGAELIDAYTGATTNAFYSHSFIFVNEPYTHTGALGIINLSDTLSFTGGITRGWDQATEDVNGNIDFIGQLKVVVDPNTTLYLNGISGNEEPDVPAGVVGHNGYRTVFDVVGSRKVGDKLTLTANGMYAWEGQTGNAGNGGGIGQWYAVAGYASYVLSDSVTLNARGEWFNDPDGAAPTQFGAVRRPNEYYEFTLGTTIHPFPTNNLLSNFFIRPEVRFDYADKATFDTVAPGVSSDHYFFSFGVDGVYAF